MTQAARTTNEDELAARLAERLLGWRIGPDRFIKPGRSWSPRSRFRPFEKIADSFQLLDRADSFSVTSTHRGRYIAEVHSGGRRGEACGEQMARAITTALARALGMEI
jgi:hypothetical protein